MKTIFVLAALCAIPRALADEDADRNAIESILASLTNRNEPPPDLFTKAAKSAGDPERLSRFRRLVFASRPPMSEVSEPRLVVQSVRFVTPDVVAVDADLSQSGSLTFWRAPVGFTMKRESRWRIAAMRVYYPLPFAPQ
jgi:hypothetical protein